MEVEDPIRLKNLSELQHLVQKSTAIAPTPSMRCTI